MYCRWWSRAAADQDDGDPNGEQGADSAAADARLEGGHQETGDEQGQDREKVFLRQRSGHKAVRDMRHAVPVGQELQEAHGPVPRGQRAQTRVLSLPEGVQEERQSQRPLQVRALWREAKQVRQLWKGVPDQERAVPARRELQRQAVTLGDGGATIDCIGGAADQDRDSDCDSGDGAAIAAAAADSGAACELATPAVAIGSGGGPGGVGGFAAAADLASNPNRGDSIAASAAPAAQG